MTPEPTPAAPRVAFLCNPLSRRVRGASDEVRALGRAVAGDAYGEASIPTGMAAFLDGVEWHEDDVLCIAGGDGTIHGVLTCLERLRSQEAWPVLAAAPGGTTNMTVKDFGPPVGLLEYLHAMRHWLAGRDTAPGALISRRVVRIAAPGQEPLAGMFFGAGVVSEGVDFFVRRLKPLGIPEAIGSPVAIARMMTSLVLGATHALSRPMTAHLDDRAPWDRPTLLCAASSLHRLIIGSHPYWGAEDAPIHTTLVDRDARGLVTGFPSLFRGDPGDRLTPERGWVSHNVRRLRLALDGPFIVDGELYHSRTDQGPLEITAERTVRWWMP